MREKYTRIRLYCFTQARSLRQTVISYDTKWLAYEMLLYMKRSDENVEKQCIYMMKAKIKVRDVFSVLPRSYEYVSVWLPQRMRSNNISLPYATKSFRQKLQEMINVEKQTNGNSNVN